MRHHWQRVTTVDKRDRRAEAWLAARHSSDWYVGGATEADWTAAYRAVDAESPSAEGGDE